MEGEGEVPCTASSPGSREGVQIIHGDQDPAGLEVQGVTRCADQSCGGCRGGGVFEGSVRSSAPGEKPLRNRSSALGKKPLRNRTSAPSAGSRYEDTVYRPQGAFPPLDCVLCLMKLHAERGIQTIPSQTPSENTKYLAQAASRFSIARIPNPKHTSLKSQPPNHLAQTAARGFLARRLVERRMLCVPSFHALARGWQVISLPRQ